MTQTIVNNMNSIYSYKERIFSVLVFGILSCAFMYVYFLQSVITNVVERENIVKDTRVLSTQVSELEAKYFSIKSSINMELANSKGFKNAEISSYISKSKLTAMANKNGI